MTAFEEQNRVRLVVTTRTCHTPEVPGFWIEGKALSMPDASGVRTLLAFQSVRCGEKGVKNLDTAFLRLLYALDFALGEREIKSAETQKA
jgi:hypothetical protein